MLTLNELIRTSATLPVGKALDYWQIYEGVREIFSATEVGGFLAMSDKSSNTHG